MMYSCTNCGMNVRINTVHYCNPGIGSHSISPPVNFPLLNTTPPMKRKTFLERARDAIYGPRQADYGTVSENFQRIASRWSAHLGSRLKSPITVEDAAIMMIDVKLSRLANTPTHEDSWTDVVGYVGCMDKYYEELGRAEVNPKGNDS